MMVHHMKKVQQQKKEHHSVRRTGTIKEKNSAEAALLGELTSEHFGHAAAVKRKTKTASISRNLSKEGASGSWVGQNKRTLRHTTLFLGQ